jgi:hypothetical protein
VLASWPMAIQRHSVEFPSTRESSCQLGRSRLIDPDQAKKGF